MTISDHPSPTVDIWSGHADFPSEPAFYRSVLDAMPTPLFVADADGLVVYGNVALMTLLRRSKDEGIRTNIYDYVHPADLVSIADAFITLATSGDDDAATSKPWAPIRCRLLMPDGSSLPVEIVGFNRLSNPDIDGFIYEVRHLVEDDIFRRVMSGAMASSDPAAFEPVIEMMAVPNLDLESAVVELSGDGSAALLATSSTEITTALTGSMGSLAQFVAGSHHATATESGIDVLPGALGARLRSLGFRNVWKLDVASPIVDRRHAVLAFASFSPTSNLGVVDWLSRSGDLANVILLRKWAASQPAAAAGRLHR